MYSMSDLNRIIVRWDNTVCLDMKRSTDGSWETLVQRDVPKSKPKKQKSAAWKRLLRRHRREEAMR